MIAEEAIRARHCIGMGHALAFLGAFDRVTFTTFLASSI